MEPRKSGQYLYCQMNDANIQKDRRNQILRKADPDPEKTEQANIRRNQIQSPEKPKTKNQKPDPERKKRSQHPEKPRDQS
jgi:hypothetical protein